MNQSQTTFPNVYVTASYALRGLLDSAAQAFVPGCFVALAVRGQTCNGVVETKAIVLDSAEQSGNALATLITSFEKCSTAVIIASDMTSLPTATFFEGLQEHSPGCDLVRLEARSMSYRFYTFERARSVARSQ